MILNPLIIYDAAVLFLKEVFNMKNTKIVHSNQCDIIEAEWVTLTWFATEEIGNSELLRIMSSRSHECGAT